MAIALLLEAGRDRGMEVATEYPVLGGLLDVVWLWRPQPLLPGAEKTIPVVGFEVESSWRTRKHLKGDFLNLADLSPALGVLVLLGESPEVEATRTFCRRMVARPGHRILIWAED